MDSSLFHIYKGFDGIEHYRFTLHRQDDNSYLVKEIEARANPAFYTAAKLKGWTMAKIEEHKTTFATDTIQEVAGILLDFFDVKVSTP